LQHQARRARRLRNARLLEHAREGLEEDPREEPTRYVSMMMMMMIMMTSMVILMMAAMMLGVIWR